jgi:hypothetical protein
MKRFAFFGFRRGGSSISFMLLETVLRESGLAAEDIVAKYHDQGCSTENIPAEALQRAFENNVLVGCFKECPEVLDKVTGIEIVPILVIRDPRDCQKSWFYARKLHEKDILASISVQDAALHDDLSEDDKFIPNAYAMLDYVRSHNGLIIKYEELVQDPIKYFLDFKEFAGVKLSRSAIDDAVIAAAFLQLIDDGANHNRLGHPFEILRTLEPSELHKMNEKFGDLAVAAGYPLLPEGLPEIDLAVMRERDVYKRYMLRLAAENGLRIEQLAQQDIIIKELQRENGFRINEIKKLQDDIHKISATKRKIAKVGRN